MEHVKLTIQAPVYPTESTIKVQTAINQVFGVIPTHESLLNGKRFLVAQGQGLRWLEPLRQLIRKERIRAAARRILISKVNQQSLCFYLNKQVAYIGRLTFSEEAGESSLGPITVHLDVKDPFKLVDWLAPRST